MGDTWDEKIIRCECHSLDHLVLFVLDDYGDVPELTVQTHLNTWRGFWNRLRLGIGYIFGRKSSHGNWDEVCVRYEQAKELRVMLDKFVAMRDARAEKMTAAER